MPYNLAHVGKENQNLPFPWCLELDYTCVANFVL